MSTPTHISFGVMDRLSLPTSSPSLILPDVLTHRVLVIPMKAYIYSSSALSLTLLIESRSVCGFTKIGRASDDVLCLRCASSKTTRGTTHGVLVCLLSCDVEITTTRWDGLFCVSSFQKQTGETHVRCASVLFELKDESRMGWKYVLCLSLPPPQKTTSARSDVLGVASFLFLKKASSER
jgi:hypothetical protein